MAGGRGGEDVKCGQDDLNCKFPSLFDHSETVILFIGTTAFGGCDATGKDWPFCASKDRLSRSRVDHLIRLSVSDRVTPWRS